MISNLEPTVSIQPQLQFVRPVGDEFQIGEFLIRRVRGDKFLIWNTEGEMLQTDSAKIESELREFSTMSSEFSNATMTTYRVSVRRHWGTHIVAGLGSQMLEADAGKLEPELRFLHLRILRCAIQLWRSPKSRIPCFVIVPIADN